MASTRAYKFTKSSVGERRFGKVDVFRRVGSASIGIKPETDGTQEIRVPLGNEPPMNFRVTVDGTAGEPDKAQAKNNSPKVAEAKQYLLEHNLEMRLSEAMQAVLRDKPADPAGFIADILVKNAGQLTRVGGPQPADAAAGDAAKAPTFPVEDLRVKAQAILTEANKNGQLDRVLAEMAPALTAVAPAPTAVLADATDTKASAPEAAASTNKIEDLRLKAKSALLNASATGQLDSILADIAGPGASAAPNELEALRKTAKDILVDATSTGKLDSVLSSLPGNSGASGADIEGLRVQAMSVLSTASKNGKLDEVLNSLNGSQAKPADPETLRMQAKQALLDASLDGRLLKTLQEGAGTSQVPEEVNVLDKLRDQAKTTLLKASVDGRLEESLKAAMLEAPGQRSLALLPMAQLYGTGFHNFGISPNFVVR